MIYAEPNSFLSRCVPREVDLLLPRCASCGVRFTPSTTCFTRSRISLCDTLHDAIENSPFATYSITQTEILPSRRTSCEAGKQKLTKGFNTLAVTNYILLNSFIINKRRTNTSNPYTGYIFIESRWYRIASLMPDRYARTKLLCFYLISVFCHILASPAKSKEIFTGQNSLFVSLLRRKSKNKLIQP